MAHSDHDCCCSVNRKLSKLQLLFNLEFVCSVCITISGRIRPKGWIGGELTIKMGMEGANKSPEN